MSIPYKTQAVTTYIGGKGVDISPSNEIRIGQVVGTTNDVVFNKVTSETIHVAENVGIGTNSPTEALDVNGNIKIDNKILGTTGVIDLFPNTTGTDSVAYLQLRPQQTSLGGTYIDFYANSTTGSDGDRAMRINSSKDIQMFGQNLYQNGVLINTSGNSSYQVVPNIGNNSHRGHLLLDTYQARIAVFDIGANIRCMVQCYSDGNVYVDGNTYFTENIILSNENKGLYLKAVQNKIVYFKTFGSYHPTFPATELTGTKWFRIRNENEVNDSQLQVYEVQASSFSNVSDDRLKHNEEIITNGLDIIRKLVPQKYQKTTDVKDADFNGELEEGTWIWEAGVIAQELEEIDELKYLVKVDEVSDDKIKGVRYNDLFVYNISATKELDKKIEVQETLIQTLLSRIEALEKK